MADEKTDTKVTAKKDSAVYSKSQILKSDKFSNHYDVLNVVLNDDKNYTLEEVLKIANDFLAKPIKEIVNE
nr:MAG TPA: hypothetical protein [Caudoviricetes sp.]DAW49698.1 MAG TPA: hypothetical protein [Caudoviricetes sp.]